MWKTLLRFCESLKWIHVSGALWGLSTHRYHPVLSCTYNMQNNTNAAMNLPEMSPLQSPSPHLANEIESMAYMNLLNETGYNRFGQDLVGTYKHHEPGCFDAL